MASGKTATIQNILISWLCSDGISSLEEATKDILEAQITMKDGLVTIKYSNGVEYVVNIIVRQIK